MVLEPQYIFQPVCQIYLHYNWSPSIHFWGWFSDRKEFRYNASKVTFSQWNILRSWIEPTTLSFLMYLLCWSQFSLWFLPCSQQKAPHQSFHHSKTTENPGSVSNYHTPRKTIICSFLALFGELYRVFSLIRIGMIQASSRQEWKEVLYSKFGYYF